MIIRDGIAAMNLVFFFLFFFPSLLHFFLPIFYVLDMQFWKRMDDFERQFLCAWALSDLLHFRLQRCDRGV
jgi:hypothetical protein